MPIKFERPQETVRFECDPFRFVELWRRWEHTIAHKESPWYSEKERAYVDYAPLKSSRIAKKGVLIRLSDVQRRCRAARRYTFRRSAEAAFVLRNPPQVLAFLKDNRSIAGLLPEARTRIKKYFPQSPVSLEVAADPEGRDPDILYVYISTDLDPEEARPKLKSFDREWWLNVLSKTHGKLCISLEYR